MKQMHSMVRQLYNFNRRQAQKSTRHPNQIRLQQNQPLISRKASNKTHINKF